jgi:CheY-like chemotaxis protein
MTVFFQKSSTPTSPAAPSEADHKTGTEIILVKDALGPFTDAAYSPHAWLHRARSGRRVSGDEPHPAQYAAHDLLITDLVMPGMNGKELAMRLRNHFRDLEVLYMSGDSDNLPVRGGESQGATMFLQKPFSPKT